MADMSDDSHDVHKTAQGIQELLHGVKEDKADCHESDVALEAKKIARDLLRFAGGLPVDKIVRHEESFTLQKELTKKLGSINSLIQWLENRRPDYATIVKKALKELRGLFRSKVSITDDDSQVFCSSDLRNRTINLAQLLRKAAKPPKVRPIDLSVGTWKKNSKCLRLLRDIDTEPMRIGVEVHDPVSALRELKRFLKHHHYHDVAGTLFSKDGRICTTVPYSQMFLQK